MSYFNKFILYYTIVLAPMRDAFNVKLILTSDISQRGGIFLKIYMRLKFTKKSKSKTMDARSAGPIRYEIGKSTTHVDVVISSYHRRRRRRRHPTQSLARRQLLSSARARNPTKKKTNSAKTYIRSTNPLVIISIVISHIFFSPVPIARIRRYTLHYYDVSDATAFAVTPICWRKSKATAALYFVCVFMCVCICVLVYVG